MPAFGPETRILRVCHRRVVIRAEMPVFHFVDVTVSVVTQAAAHAVFVTSIRTTVHTADVCDWLLLLSPHLSNNFQ